MKKKILRHALVAVLLVGMLGGIGASPASATHGHGLCVIATGTATLNTGLYAVGLGPPVVATVAAVAPGLIVCTGGAYGGTTGTVSGHLVGAWTSTTTAAAPTTPVGGTVTTTNTPVTPTTVTGTLTTPAGTVTATVTGDATGPGGWCGQSVGTVNVTAGTEVHTGTWVSAGTQLIITGTTTSTTTAKAGVYGSVNAVVDATITLTTANSCTNGTATQFLVNGGVAFA